jgi:acetyltransferase-like isoleucine patch superfamily enzyme
MILRRLLNLHRRLSMALASRGRNLLLRAWGVRINGYCWLRDIEIPRDHHNIELNACSLDRDVVLLCSGPPGDGIKLSIGQGTYVNRGTFFDVTELLIVGNHAAIGPGCYITDHDHGTDPAKKPLDQAMVSIPTRIGNEVWIGAHVTILKGVTIGDKTIVGAGSVVTKSLPAGVIAAGVPAKIIRQRTALAGAGIPA